MSVPSGTIVAYGSFEADGGMVEDDKIERDKLFPTIMFKFPTSEDPEANISLVFASSL